MNEYEERQQRRRERLQARADQAEQEADRRFGTARQIGDQIPFGQPILVGHHSERRHRNAIDKIDNNMRKGVEASRQAEELRGAAAAVGTGGVSSDDPEAISKLEAQVADLERQQERMKATNKLVKKNDRAGLAEMGYSEPEIDQLFAPDFAGRIGYPSYALTNNNANIRRIKERIEQLRKLPAAQEAFASIQGDGWLVFAEDNRLCIHFDDKPDAAMRDKLKACGFKWSPTRNAWVRQFSNAAIYNAKYILEIGN